MQPQTEKKCPEEMYAKFVNASTPLSHALTPEKNRLIFIIFQCEYFPYFDH